MQPKFARLASIALLVISAFCANFATADAAYSFWKWLNFGSDSDSTDFSISLPNVAPSAPTLVAPRDGNYLVDATPQLSVRYSDSDTGDVGTTNFRIALSALGCADSSTLVASGTSATTLSNSAVSYWSPTSDLADGTYFWCAQNDDGAAQSAWTSGAGDGWSFILDTTAPTIIDGSALASNNSTITIPFSSAVYSENNATGDLAAGDFTATLTSNSGGATAVSISSVGHTAGSATAIIYLSFTGTPTGVESISISPADGASIFDIAGNAMSADQSTDSKILNDRAAPTVVAIDSDTADGQYSAGTTIDLNIQFSEAVSSTGLATIKLETGTLDRGCSFEITNNSTATCEYLVQFGDLSADLDATIAGTIADAAGNAMTNFTPATTLATNKNLVIDAVVPDIDAVDAGASSADRTSLTSASWFENSATGSDDAISFSWTDPTSASDDTFFYELNSTATATISGNESSVATNFVDDIAIAEGTNYFHVRPRSGSGTFGVERIFTVKYDKTAPTSTAAVSAGTLGGASFYISNPSVAITTADATSGVAATNYCVDQSDSCSPSSTYSTAVELSTDGTNYFRFASTDSAGNIQSTQSLTIKIDKSGPTGGSVAHFDSLQNSATIAITVDSGADATSGMSTTDSDYLLEYRSAILSANSCGSFGEWTDSAISETASATNYDFTATSGNCYQFRYSVADIAGNSATFTSSNTTKVDTVAPVDPTLDFTDGFTNSTAQIVAFSATDSASGVASFTLANRVATLSGGICGAFGEWSSLGTQTSPYSASLTSGNCYQYQITATDAAGNSVNYISAATIKVDTAAPTVETPTDEGAVSADQILEFTFAAASDAASGVASLSICIDDDKAGDCEKEVSLAIDAIGYDWSADPAPSWGTTYFARLTATDSAGNSATSGWSDGVTPDGSPPALSADLASEDWYSTDQTITLSASDAESGLNEARYSWDTNDLAADCLSGGTTFTDGTQITFSTEGSHILYLCAVDNAANAATWSGGYKLDKTDPTVATTTLTAPNGGEIWTGGGGAEYEITWNSADFTDATSGLATDPITLEYSTNGGTDWISIATGEPNDGEYSWTTPDLSDSEMRIRISATDLAGNSASDASDADFRLSAHDNFIALYIISGNNQLGGIDATLSNDLKIRVGNGADSGETFAGADAVEVSFTLNSVPESPTAVGQNLAAGSFGTTFGGTSVVKTATTDADGFASVAFTLGDRAGEYSVVANFTDCETAEIDRTFTATEREIFSFSIVPNNLNLELDPTDDSADSDSTTLAITTNAASFSLAANPQSWLAAGEDTIENWTGLLGFGWDNNNSGTSGGVSAITAFAGVATPTTIFSCAGDSCQGSQNFALDFRSKIDFGYAAGSYENVLEIDGISLEF